MRNICLFLVVFLVSGCASWRSAHNCTEDADSLYMGNFEEWTKIKNRFPQQIPGKDSTLLIIGEMDAWGAYYILEFVQSAQDGPIGANLYSEFPVGDEATKTKSAHWNQADSILSKFRSMGLDELKSQKPAHHSGCGPAAIDASNYFVDSRINGTHNFGFSTGMPLGDIRYHHIARFMGTTFSAFK